MVAFLTAKSSEYRDRSLQLIQESSSIILLDLSQNLVVQLLELRPFLALDELASLPESLNYQGVVVGQSDLSDFNF